MGKIIVKELSVGDHVCKRPGYFSWLNMDDGDGQASDAGFLAADKLKDVVVPYQMKG